ncbi:MAG: alpha/beta fold hydrolase [Pseudomonadota bacterium]
MIGRRGVLAMALAVGACGPRGAFVMRPMQAGRTVQPVLMVSPNGTGLTAAQIDVSLPADRSPGSLAFSGPDAFGLDRTIPLDRAGLLGALAAAPPSDAPVTVFVHGYNNNSAEAVYRLAQMAQDFGDDGPNVAFVWPSLATALGYLADRDASLRSRDALADLLNLLAREQSRPIVLVAHSMGGFLTMETLRQLALADRLPRDRMAALILISPDVDIDLFRSQARAIGRLPQPFLITVSDQDRILGLSARLGGRRARLGSPDDLSRLADLDVTVVDLSTAGGDVAQRHLSAATSPEAIAWLRALETSPGAWQDRTGVGLLELALPAQARSAFR